MKKFLALVAFIALAACGGSYDYYAGDVRYVQDGEDCIYYAEESANRYSRDVDSADVDKKIVYRYTRCADLYARDMGGKTVRNERRVMTAAAESAPAAEPVSVVVKPVAVKKSCGCAACKKTTTQYVVVGM